MPTPAGAYYAVSSSKPDAGRRLVMSLMAGIESPQLDLQVLEKKLEGQAGTDVAELLYNLQKLGYVQAVAKPYAPPGKSLEEVLSPILVQLSSVGKALLADAQGFYIATAGFAHESAEEISALSADLAVLHARHTGLIEKNLGLSSSSWGLIDASGNSQLGLWPLYIGEYRFVLALAGMPLLNQPQFTDLVWLLFRRYGGVVSGV